MSLPSIGVATRAWGAWFAWETSDGKQHKQQETANFVAELCKELRELTDGVALNSLTYLLDMTVMEAARASEPAQRLKSAVKAAP